MKEKKLVKEVIEATRIADVKTNRDICLPIIEKVESDDVVSLEHSAGGLEQVGPSITTSFVDRSSHFEEEP